MPRPGTDQADGLRRMFSADRLRVVALLAGAAGVGRTTVAANLSAALARAGRAVLLADANPKAPGALGMLGLSPRTDAAAALDRGAPLESAIVHAADGLEAVRLGDVPRDARALHLAEGLLQHAAAFDYLLLNCPDPSFVATLGVDPERLHVVIVLSRPAASITGAYALVKQLSTTRSLRRFHVLASRVEGEADAAVIFRNMARVAEGYLSVALQLAGHLPEDEHIARAARLGRSVLDAWPDAPGAAALRRLAQTMGDWPVPRSAPVPAAALAAAGPVLR